MRLVRSAVVAILFLSAFGFRAAAVFATEETIAGEPLDLSLCGPSFIESMEEAIERDHLTPIPKNLGDRQGRQGTWTVPSRGATTFQPHSGQHYAVNEWGDTRMGIGFGRLVDVRGAYFAGQANRGAWTTGIRVLGYREGQEVQRTDWFQDIGPEPRWFEMNLRGVDRIEIMVIPVLRGGGWYGIDDLTYAPTAEGTGPAAQTIVVNFDDLPYNRKLTGTNYAGLTWETGTGDFSEGEGVPAPMVPPGLRSEEIPPGEEMPPSGLRATLPTLVTTYQGVIRGDAGSMSYPPDTDGAIGPNHYVETVNRNFAVYNKTTGAQLVNILLGSFLPGSNGDPRVLFDHHSGRWIVLVDDFNTRLYLAVSLTSDPTGSWYKTNILVSQGSDADKWPDYPTLGVDANGIYTAAYMVGGGMSIFAIDKAPLIAPTPSLGTVTAFRNLPWEGAIQPAHTYGTPPGEYLVSVPSQSALRVRRVNPPLTAPTLTEVGTVSVAAFSDPPDAPAQGSGTPLDTVDDRLMMAVYRNGSLWTAHTIAVSGRAGCRWYELNAAAHSLIQSGTVADSTLYYFFPSIMVNQFGHAAMGFTGSKATQYASCYYTGRLASDPPGDMAAPVMFKAGTGPQNNIDGYGRNRWGDYSYTTLDPVDQATFWTIQEYGHATDIWGTYMAVLTTGPTPPIAQDGAASTAVSVSVTITLNAADDGLPDPPAALSYIITSLPAHGGLADPGTGAISTVPYSLVGGGNQVGYAPNGGYTGPDSFSFKANDGGAPPEGGDSNTAVVTVTMGGPAWDPVASNGVATTAVSIAVDITLVGTDPNNDPLTYVIESLPAAGFLSDPAAGAITSVPYPLVGGGQVVTYQPPCGQALNDSFTFSVHDATAGSNLATVSVTVSQASARLVYRFSLDSDPGWSTQGAWAFGTPTGAASHHGDPAAGYTGVNVYGYNLSGDYTNNLPVRYLTTPAINCWNVTNTELRFRRWLGVESAEYDHADIEVSNNGTSWTTLWEHTGTDPISDSSWSLQSYDISAVADGQTTVYLRWGMGPTDDTVTYPGWNLDDVELWGVVPAVSGDFNADGRADLADFAIFNGCLSGPGETTAVPCRCVDLDQDGDVDLGDFAVFQTAFAG